MSSTYLVLVILFFCVLLPALYERREIICRKVRRKRTKLTEEERSAMSEMIKEFIGKRCLIYTAGTSASGCDGTVENVDGNWVKLSHADGSTELISVDYIQRIREYPVNKKGKPKSVVLD